MGGQELRKEKSREVVSREEGIPEGKGAQEEVEPEKKRGRRKGSKGGRRAGEEGESERRLGQGRWE